MPRAISALSAATYGVILLHRIHDDAALAALGHVHGYVTLTIELERSFQYAEHLLRDGDSTLRIGGG